MSMKSCNYLKFVAHILYGKCFGVKASKKPYSHIKGLWVGSSAHPKQSSLTWYQGYWGVGTLSLVRRKALAETWALFTGCKACVPRDVDDPLTYLEQLWGLSQFLWCSLLLLLVSMHLRSSNLIWFGIRRSLSIEALFSHP